MTLNLKSQTVQTEIPLLPMHLPSDTQAGIQGAKQKPLTLNRITVNPSVCLGQPTIRAMRITVSVVLKMLGSGASIAEILIAYPELEADDIYQAIQYAAWVVSDQVRLVA